MFRHLFSRGLMTTVQPHGAMYLCSETTTSGSMSLSPESPNSKPGAVSDITVTMSDHTAPCCVSHSSKVQEKNMREAYNGTMPPSRRTGGTFN